MASKPHRFLRLAAMAGATVLALLVVLSALGWAPARNGGSADDGRYDPLAAPDRLGGFPRWYGMADGELRDATRFRRRFHAAAIEASYLPPGLDPLLAMAVRAHDPDSESGGVAYGKVLCTSQGLFVECYRTGEKLTVDVLAPKAMKEHDVADLVAEFWHAQHVL